LGSASADGRTVPNGSNDGFRRRRKRFGTSLPALARGRASFAERHIQARCSDRVRWRHRTHHRWIAGIGCADAKVIAAGGGRVIVTYAIGREEAIELAEEIHAHVPQGVCDVIPYDARQDAAEQLKTLIADVSHLYYFATPPITRQKEGLFVSSLFDEFIQVYVKGFYDCCRFLGERGSRAVTAFYHRPCSSRTTHYPWPNTAWPRWRVKSCVTI